jgi:hypothetical protein
VLPQGEKLLPDALVRLLCKIWGEAGHQTFVARGPDVDADIALVHTDTTIVNPAIVPAPRAGLTILNGRALDISKRRVSKYLVSREDEYGGPVIIKTDHNAYGIPMFPMSRAYYEKLLRRRSATLENWRDAGVLPLYEYPILASKSDVPDWAWADPDIVVERFMPEIEDDLFVLRMWIFLGNRGVGLKIYSRDPIVKSRQRVRYEYFTDIPHELRAERERLGFDFGKFDYVMRDGKAVLLDANTTPTISTPEQAMEYAPILAAALSDMFPGRA